MAAIPSSGSLVATHDYYRRRLGSSSSSSSGGSAEYPGDAVLQSPGLPKADPGHWWASFFFGKSTLPFMTTVLESPERIPPGLQKPDDLWPDPETMKQQPVIHSGQTNPRDLS